MPELSRFNGIIVSMRYSDDDKHHKPHVHAVYEKQKLSISLDGEVLAGIFPRRQLNMVRGWLALHENELYAAWNKAVQDIPIDKIEPLR